MTEIIQGTVERVTYCNEENGYSVIKVRMPMRKDLVSVVGNFVSVNPGEVLRMEGDWSFHARFGEQFKVERYETAAPATVEGIRKYLGSGLIKGIGPVMAKRIVNRFGDRTLEVIDAEPQKLAEVEGIGSYRLEQIRKAWEDQKDIRDLMVFLRSHGVSAAFAARIFKHYGKSSLEKVQENPYRLAMDVSGIGFITADKVARNLGFSVDSPLRAEAGILYVLQEATDEGHVCVPSLWLMEKSRELLEIPSPVLEEAVLRLVSEGRLVKENIPRGLSPSFESDAAIYLRGYHIAECQIAQRLLYLQAFKPLQRKVDPEAAIDWLRDKLPFKLAPLQEEAVKKALTEKVVVITGGPGTGKTTLIQAILAIYRKLGGHVCLAAPTGRAAKRLNESTRYPAGTLHRLLEFSPQLGGFQRNEQKPLSADLIIVDESSMLDTLLMHYLLKAVPSDATLVLVGDVDQLPSVGPGNVLRDIIASERFPVVRLTEIFRQAQKSSIVTNAHLIQQGKFPRLQRDSEDLQDFYFIEKEDPEEVSRIILKLCKERIPARFGLDPVESVQVLSPMHKGIIGAQRLNTVLQEALNPQKISIERGGRIFRLHDKVMQIRNNYDKDVFNGDLGRIQKIDMENQEVQVEIDGRSVPYDFSELDELVLAYAVSVHKAQGSEYPAVVFPLLTQHYLMLQRNLLYTAITRARKLVVIVGSKKALAIAVRNNKMQQRYTLLRERIMGGGSLTSNGPPACASDSGSDETAKI
ncbi:SF1B family DNA helicase RecD2 [Desulforhabdus amnigena]|jgi:exodeoxyribonuclease V alpha subunit|uniref:ATP-dependent RecD-like DNA helicase n=1 Tax=Desulforhabdus amnigena TaxID=40218 RepID=A0A9W6L951_9BACT|nr:ATP-dependent RecD-like DNA helicase [Desulforhabdus amnigena]NLJ27440.1 ATP-dependent RecD-like DNA helicase [Deltaproteobacteria bacterium]GLI34965.1 ATP-dependent RecD-like DNA helicase [Desulforhabdus amnigena]